MTQYAFTDTPDFDYPPLPEFPPRIAWKGKSGIEYEYTACYLETGGEFFPGAANYVFAREVEPNKFVPVYIGETDDLSRLFDDHHMMRFIERHKATHICVRDSGRSEVERQQEKKDLLDYWRPALQRLEMRVV